MKKSIIALVAAFAAAGLCFAQPTPAQQTQTGPSSAGRAVVIVQYTSTTWVEKIVDSFNARFDTHLKGIGGFTMVPVSGRGTRWSTTEDVQNLCKRYNADALIAPFGGAQVSESTALVGVGLEVSDCYGVPFYDGFKYKTENRQWIHSALDKEVIDMGNDLIDQLLADFAQYRTAHAAAWSNLMQNGVPVDPSAPDSRILAGLGYEERLGFFIEHVRPGGIAEKAGLRVDDVLVAIAGQPVDKKKTAFELLQQADSAQNITVKRDGKDITVVLRQVGSVGRSPR